MLGVVLGYRGIPESWKSGIPAIADRKFSFTEFTFRTIVESTLQRAVALVGKNGGRLEGDRLLVKPQKPTAASLELWDDYGSPVERISASDPRWSWKGEWAVQSEDRRGAKRVTRTTSEKGSEAAIGFDGIGAIVTGPYLATGGKAEVILDGSRQGAVDVYPDEPGRKNGESVWHVFGLPRGRHTVRVVVTGEPYRGSKGSDVAIEDVVVFR